MRTTNENVTVVGAFPNFSWFISISLRNISPHGANNNERELTKDEKQRFQNNVRANFSVYDRMPNFLKNVPYAGVRCATSLYIVWRGLYQFAILAIKAADYPENEWSYAK